MLDWLRNYRVRAAESDRLTGRRDHLALLAAGLLGEAGSVAAEAKKMQREGPAYPAYRRRLVEELGDFLWYFVRFVDVGGFDPIDLTATASSADPESDLVSTSLELGAAVSQLLAQPTDRPTTQTSAQLRTVWERLAAVASNSEVMLHDAADRNLAKVQSRWPTVRHAHPLFDEGDPIEDQIPRSLAVEFVQRGSSGQETVFLRYQGIGIGDRITDNIADPDSYRYHDVFHMAHAAFLGWSPVVRSLLRCKRKSNPRLDCDQDGARAVIVEEAVSAITFARAKEMRFFESATQLDYDLLKAIQEHVTGYEVDQVPLWQWEEAILKGYSVFRLLREHGGGRVGWDLRRRELSWAPPSA